MELVGPMGDREGMLVVAVEESGISLPARTHQRSPGNQTVENTASTHVWRVPVWTSQSVLVRVNHRSRHIYFTYLSTCTHTP